LLNPPRTDREFAMNALASRPPCPVSTGVECCPFRIAGHCCHSAFENGCPQQGVRPTLSLLLRPADQRPAIVQAGK